MSRSINWSLVQRLALRDLRGGLRGFRVFVICVALGVAVIAAVGAGSDSLKAGFSAEGREMLGGDVSVSRVHERAGLDERNALVALGRVSEIATLRGMAGKTRASNASDDAVLARVMVEIKAVDAAYPLLGAVRGGTRRDPMVAMRNGRSVIVAPLLLERMQVGIGDTITLGAATLTIVDTLAREPDGLSARASFGPRVLMSQKTLDATGLVAPGSLVRWRYRVALSEGSDGGDTNVFDATVDGLKARLSPLGFRVRDRRDPTPGITRAIDRFRQFLTLVGLTAMLVGGVGVANAVSTYLADRRSTIAIFKVLGARQRDVLAIYLFEILMIAALGVGLGLVLGVGLPWLAWQALGSNLAIPLEFSVAPLTLAVAAGYGFLVSLAFVLWPLGQIEQVRPAALFRDMVAPERRRPHWRVLVAIGVVVALLVALTLLGSSQPRIVGGVLAGIAALFAVFVGLAWVIKFAAQRLPHPGRPELALALRNLSGPGALTQAVVLSLGTGLTLLVAVTLTNASLISELETRMPSEAPSFYFLDVNKSDADGFSGAIKAVAPTATLRKAPMLRGRLMTLRGIAADKIKAPGNVQWVLNGDRGLTFAARAPEESRIVAGAWWAEDYTGAPLVSFEAEIAKGLGLTVGDMVTVNVLGRPISARIANLRTVDWGSLSINFVMVFTPNTLAAAPFNYLMTLAYPKPPTLGDEARVLRAMGVKFPAVTAIRVRDALDAIGAILSRVMLAVRAVGGFTLLVGAVVLAGAITTSQRRRTHQAVLLKTLGVARRRIFVTGLVEFAVLGLCAATVAVLLGGLAAWAITTFAMDVGFVFAPVAVLEAVGLALVLVFVLGGLSLRRTLAAPAVPYLRTS